MRYLQTVLMVDDVAAAVAFYRDAFGLEQGFADPDGTFTVLAGSEVSIAFERWSKISDYAKPEKPAGFRIFIEVEDTGKAYARALEAGATSAQEPMTRPWGQVVAAVRDLNGAIVELGEPVKMT